ncbi:hypothetical protein LTR62_001458 [Meristemomyces frigidus]|uniref:Kinetochore protein Mis13 n=1 Tax=Meristemomyces frigidus TaxID=1508187 RepID=A0AAN7TK63_9PEZI|nr:hypothetical protein LTR62_001458 [Meristemomyces frigidus]
MNGAGTSKRRSARLSLEGPEENEPPMKKSRANGTQATTVSTKEQDGDANGPAKRRPRKAYHEEVDDFVFNKGGRKAKEAKKPAVRTSGPEKQASASDASGKDREVMPPPPQPSAAPAPQTASMPASSEEVAPKPLQKKNRRRFPTTPEREAAEKPIRRSKRISNEGSSSDPPRAPSPHKASHAISHANIERSPSPEKARPITVEKKRKRGENGLEEEEKVMRIALPFQDTPVIRRNKEMRKSSAGGDRRTSTGMRGRRASSLIDEGRGNGKFVCIPFSMGNERVSSTLHIQMSRPLDFKDKQRLELHVPQQSLADPISCRTALPHAEVPTGDFFKHISEDLTEPRRMRCLLGWCGTRALPPKPDAPKDSTPASSMEFQALQAARVIQEELLQDLITKGTLSDWFSRDETIVPTIPTRKIPNPRNFANAAKAEELERELERLKTERAEWDAVMKSAIPASPPAESGAKDEQHVLSPLHTDLLSSPERAIYEELQQPTTDPTSIQQRLLEITPNLEFSVDQFAHGVHALNTSRELAEKLAEKTLGAAAEVLDSREKTRRVEGGGADPLDALKALGKVLNGGRRR